MRNKKWLIILSIIVIAAIFSAFRAYNIYMLEKVFNEISANMSNLLQNSNFTYEVSSTSDAVFNVKKWVYDKEKVALKRTNAIYYADLSKDDMYVANIENKTYIKIDKNVMPQIKPEIFIHAPVFYSITQIKDLRILFFASVKEEVLNDIVCYKIKLYDKDETWINKETLMPVKYIHDGVEYTYSIIQNNVKEEDVIFKDIDSFVEINEN